QHRADKTRIELAEQRHRLDRRLTQMRQAAFETLATEKPLVRFQRVVDFPVRRHRVPTGRRAEPRRRLALRGEKIANALFGHDARGFLRDGLAQRGATDCRLAARQNRMSSSRSRSSLRSAARVSASSRSRSCARKYSK